MTYIETNEGGSTDGGEYYSRQSRARNREQSSQRIKIGFTLASIAVLIVLGVGAISMIMDWVLVPYKTDVQDTPPSSAINQVIEPPSQIAPLSQVVTPSVENAPSTPQSVEQQPKVKGRIIAIDAGHQQKGDSSLEAIGPGSNEKKAKVSSGAMGVVTRVPEYKLNLIVAKKLARNLEQRGYSVVMIRDKDFVNISNSERSRIANEAGADLLVRIHANGDANSGKRGYLTLVPKKNEWTGPIAANSSRAGNAIHSSVLKNTGARDNGVLAVGNMTGFNWSKIPCVIVEMGYLSNADDDRLLQTSEYQAKIIEGIGQGIDEYFE